jgi:hypothetical protein
MSQTADRPDDLVNVPVPRRHYPLIIQTLANALAAEGSADGSSNSGRPWTAEEVQLLRRLVENKTVQLLMELVCASPGKRVSFEEVYRRAGRSSPQARADLAGFTKLIRHRFHRDAWPINVVQSPDGGLTYDADPVIAKAWNAGG